MSSRRIIDLRSARTVRRESTRRSHRESERRSPLRERRRKVRIIAFLASVVLVAAAAYGLHALSYVERLSIQEVRVEGAIKVGDRAIVERVNAVLDDGAFHFFSRRSIALYPKRELALALTDAFPRILSVEITRPSYLSPVLIVHVVEREPFATWCMGVERDVPACYRMDAEGFIFAEVIDGESVATRYVFRGTLAHEGAWPIGTTFAPTHVPGMVAMFSYLEKAGFPPSGASVESDHDFFVHLDRGFYLKASFGQDAAQLAHNLELIVASDALRGKEDRLEYVDLRFGNRVYYKFKGEIESEAS